VKVTRPKGQHWSLFSHQSDRYGARASHSVPVNSSFVGTYWACPCRDGFDLDGWQHTDMVYLTADVTQY